MSEDGKGPIAGYITRFREIMDAGGEERRDRYRQHMIDMLDDPDIDECPIILMPESQTLFSIEPRETVVYSLNRAIHAVLHFYGEY